MTGASSVDIALSLCFWLWIIGHLAQIGCLVGIGITDGPALSEREEQLLGVSLLASLPSMFGLPLLVVAGTLSAVLVLPLLLIGGVTTLICVLLPPRRGGVRQAYAARLCAVPPPWAALYVLAYMLVEGMSGV